MADILITGAEKIEPAPPYDDEWQVIDQFAQSDAAVGALQARVAGGVAAVCIDPEELLSVIDEIFSATNDALEDALDRELGRSRNLREGQPRVLARAIGSVPSLNRFIARGFGRPHLEEQIAEGVQSFDQIHDIFELLLIEFLAEADVVRESEGSVSINEIREYQAETAGSYDRNATHTFISSRPAGEDRVFLLAIPPGSIRTATKQLQVLDDPHESDFVSMSMLRADLIDYLRHDLSRFQASLKDHFFKNWDKFVFLKSMGVDSHNFASHVAIEKILFNYIINTNLNDDDTVEHSESGAPNKDQSGGQEDHPLLAESVIKRLMTLDEFAKANPGKPVSETALDLFPELWEIEQARPQPISLPTTAPARWSDDRKLVDGSLENPPQFIARVYAPWLGKGLTRADVRRLDEPLAQALYYHIRRNGEPVDLDLPTKAQVNDRWIAKLEQEGAGAIVGAAGVESARLLQRLQQAKQRRNRGRDD